MQYVVVYEQTPNNWAAYVPDLPGCVAAGDTRQEVEELIRDAIALHLASLRDENEPVPQPGTWVGTIDIDEQHVASLVEGFRAEHRAGDIQPKRAAGT
jgi:predicted RNase H-like HicB family nuclease